MIFLFFLFEVKNAVSTDRLQKQWVSLGCASAYACLTIPESCGSAGGALSAWIKIGSCPGNGGIISSYHLGQEGFIITCDKDTLA